MTKAKLTYFDISGSRGEECRLALHLAGIEFEDNRIKYADWPAVKATTPFATERLLGEGPFVAGAKLHVVDLKLFMVVRWFATGTVDHIPATVFEAFPKLHRLYQAVGAHAGVKAWSAR